MVVAIASKVLAHTGVIGLSTESVIGETRVSDVHDRWELRK